MSLLFLNQGFEKQFKTIIIILFLSFIFLSFLQPLADPDTPWHLKTGEYIYLHKTIPTSDPFSFANDTIPFYGKFILTQNWLSQVFFFLVYKIAGPFGIVMTGAIIFTSLLVILWILIRHTGFYISLFITGGFALNVLNNFSGIRPQIFTFLFAALVIFLLEQYKKNYSLSYLYPFPFLMILWANMHGGFVYGILLMSIYIFSQGVNLYFHRNIIQTDKDPIPWTHFRRLLIFCGISVAVSFINPNTYKTFLYIFLTHSSSMYMHIDEYLSPLTLMTAKIHPEIVYSFWAYLAVATALILIFIKNRTLYPALLLLFAIIPAIFSIRYIPLFAIVTVATFSYVPFSRKTRVSVKTSVAINFLTIILLGVLILSSHPFKSKELFQINENGCYAVRAAEFLSKNRIFGNIFCSYNKSGFLLFRLFPESKLYSDARFINEERIKKSSIILGGYDSIKAILESIDKLRSKDIGTIRIDFLDKQKSLTEENASYSPENKKWKTLLDSINAEIIVHEAVNLYSGDIYPLVFKLIQEDTWELVYLDGNVMVFVKDIPKFKEIIAHHRKSKTLIYDEIIQECLIWIDKNTSRYHSSIALALLLKGIADNNTHHLIEKAILIDPKNITAQYCKALYLLMINKR